MNFGFDAIHLWSKSGELRSVKFERNKVNVLTGECHTGKSALLDIIDYCFLATSHKLPDSVINENVDWYGLTFYVHDKTYTLARKSPNENRVSDEYYFSSVGDVPSVPTASTKEADIKIVLESEFKLDEKVTVAYGGRVLRAGSQVSFRYFFLFNTISEDIITSKEVFFDKQTQERYREALPRIFDIALGIDDLGNIAAREKREAIAKEIQKAERKASHLSSGRSLFEEEIRGIASQAAEYGVLSGNEVEPSLEVVRNAISAAAKAKPVSDNNTYAVLSAKLFNTERQLRKLKSFTADYRSYKTSLEKAEDSLLPIEAILKQSPTIAKTDIFDDLISGLKSDLLEIKKSLDGKQPVDGQISEMIRSLESQKASLRQTMSFVEREIKSFDSDRQKWLFIGESIGKFKAYQDDTSSELQIGTASVDSLQSDFDAISVRDVEETRTAVISLINEFAQALLKETEDAMANYANWLTDFSYKEKRLRMRKPRSALIENVGSSSNHMFLHLLHFLALHEVAINRKSEFIPAFLIIDQPSRPYYPNEKASDNVKIGNTDSRIVQLAFKLLNSFVERMNSEYATPFQMIVFEHVPKETFDGMNQVHLLPEFRNGEALIPASWYTDRIE